MKINHLRMIDRLWGSAPGTTAGACALAGALLLTANPAAALAVDAGALAQMSLEELIAVAVTSVAGIGQSRHHAGGVVRAHRR